MVPDILIIYLLAITPFFADFLRTVACHVTRISLFRMALYEEHVTIKHLIYVLFFFELHRPESAVLLLAARVNQATNPPLLIGNSIRIPLQT